MKPIPCRTECADAGEIHLFVETCSFIGRSLELSAPRNIATRDNALKARNRVTLARGRTRDPSRCYPASRRCNTGDADTRTPPIALLFLRRPTWHLGNRLAKSVAEVVAGCGARKMPARLASRLHTPVVAAKLRFGQPEAFRPAWRVRGTAATSPIPSRQAHTDRIGMPRMFVQAQSRLRHVRAVLASHQSTGIGRFAPPTRASVPKRRQQEYSFQRCFMGS